MYLKGGENMGEHKGVITLIIIVLILFGIFVAFATGVIDPMMDKVGNNFERMVDDVFDGIGGNSESDMR